MDTRSGKVVDVQYESKSPPGKRPFKVHRVVLNNGDEVEVGYKQPYKIGDLFNSEVEFKYGKWKEIRPLGSVPSGTAGGSSAASAPTPAPAAMAFPIPKANKETAIIRQNALTNAVNFFNNAGAPHMAGMALDEQADYVLKLAYKFAEFSSGQREMRLAKELAGDSED